MKSEDLFEFKFCNSSKCFFENNIMTIFRIP